jgi:hypothetical protein
MRERYLLIPGLILGVCVVAFSQYRIKEVTVLPVESYPAKATVGPITIAADPYSSDEKSFKAFDVKDLNSRGYHPLHVIIRNESQEYFSLRTRTITLVTASGQEFYTTSATNVVEDVVKGGLTAKQPKNSRDDLRGLGKQGSPLADFGGKELTSRQIDPGSTVSGFLFFYVPGLRKDLFSGATLRIPDVQFEGTKKSLGLFEIPLQAGPR